VIAVIFDMDGLMLDTESVAKTAWQRAAVELGYPISDDLYLSMLGRDLRDTEDILVESLGPSFSFETLRGRYLIHFNDHVDRYGVRTKPGLDPLLDYLDRHGIPKSIATSTGRHRATARLERAGVLGRFTHIVTGDEVSRGKPAPDIFLKAAEKMNAAPSDCFVLEDTEAGIQAAHAAGMAPICIPDLKRPSPEIARLASRILPSLVEARDHFETLLKG
jgi:HAD superfamily hydrolase (TIGR01509 family)